MIRGHEIKSDSLTSHETELMDNPKERTNPILTQISNCLAEECDVDSNEIVIFAIVSSDDDKRDWLCTPGFEGTLIKDKLTKGDSALKQVIDEQTYF